MSQSLSSAQQVSRAVLLLPISTLCFPSNYPAPIAVAAAAAQTSLTIVFRSQLFSPSSDISHTKTWRNTQELITCAYVHASSVAQSKDKLLMEIDVLLAGPDDPILREGDQPFEKVFRIDGDSASLPRPLTSIPVVRVATDHPIRPSEPANPDPHERPPFYPVVILGGTFDHLHPGHKILLSMAAWIASEKVIVGVTDDTLLQNKSHKDILESLAERIDRVRTFLNKFRPGLVYDIVPISDVYGPTGWDSNIQALVVSTETIAGSQSIAKRREELSLPALETFVIEVISSESTALSHADMDTLRQAKMSSTAIRKWINERGGGQLEGE